MSKTLLLIEDQTISAHIMFNIVEKHYQIAFGRCIADARNLLCKNKIDLILLDNQLPDGVGIDFCRELQLDETTRHIPVIMVTSDTDIETELAALKAGAVDFIRKPPNKAIALERIKKHL